MIQKIEITHQVLKLLKPDYTDRDLKVALTTWWTSTRKKESGGLRLCEHGFNIFLKAGIKEHKVKFDEPINYTSQLVIWMDRFIDCPFYVTNKEIYVFSEKMAVQLVLFSGNIERFSAAKAGKLKPV